MTKIKRMSVSEFRKLGYLREVNRCFLHPLGLALEIVVEVDGTMRFGEVHDYRDDPEGLMYGEDIVSTQQASEDAQRILAERDAKSVQRQTSFNWPTTIQPISHNK